MKNRGFDKNKKGGSDFRDQKKPYNKKPQGEKRPPGGGKPFHGNPRSPAKERFSGKATLWGVHAVTEAWKNPARTIRALYITEPALAEFAPVLSAHAKERPAPTVVERHQIDQMLPPGAVHQGIAVDAAPLEEIFLQDLIIHATNKPRSVFVVLDQVTDPHNVGAVLRSACAFGADGLIMQSRHAPEINGVLAKAASGAVEHMPLAYETNLSRAVNHLQEEGYTAMALDERGETSIADYDFPARVVIVLGAEGKGLRQGLRENCDITLRLPTGGAVGSLNVSNAAAVALYAFAARKNP